MLAFLEQLHLNTSWWDAFGWAAQLMFASRFIVQWIESERKQESVIPLAFWYLSIVGSLLSLVYAISIGSAPLIAGYAFNWVVYVRNLILIHRKGAEAKAVPS